VNFVCIEHFVGVLGAKSNYFPLSSLIINILHLCMDNPSVG